MGETVDLELLRDLGIALLILMALGLVAGSLLLALAVVQLRRIQIPPDATFVETLHMIPLVLVLAIDLLDLGLDVLAAPVSWIILDRLGLKALRSLATVEALIPGTQFLPTLTACWIGVRLFGIY
jgi:hypothetical protein